MKQGILHRISNPQLVSSKVKAVCGRFAPSPTGLLHLGNAWAFLLAWLAARAQQGTMVLRIEDIDPERSREQYSQALMDDLRWLGLDWDFGPDKIPASGTMAQPYIQSQRYASYEAALQKLEQQGLVYPCYCTRKEIRALASAPHGGEPLYNGQCRTLSLQERARHEKAGHHAALRLRCAEMAVHFTDLLYGEQQTTLAECGGDFALRRSDGVIAYQLAVVVDDAAMRISQVVRGNDLLPATPRQLALYSMLGLPPPEYLHVPLLLDSQGERLAKRHASLTLQSLREGGIRATQICGYLGWRAGLCEPTAHRPEDLIPTFSVTALPRANLHIPDDVRTQLAKI